MGKILSSSMLILVTVNLITEGESEAKNAGSCLSVSSSNNHYFASLECRAEYIYWLPYFKDPFAERAHI